MAKKTENNINKTAVAIGAVGVAAAAVGAYWLYGSKNSAKNRKHVSSWMLKARADVMEAVEKVEKLDKQTYLDIVDNVMKKYAGLNHATTDVSAVVKEMKSAWTHIKAAAKPVKKALK